MIGTPITIKNHETGDTIVLNDHVTDPNNVIALQSFPTFEPEVRSNLLPKQGAHGEFRLPHYYTGISVVLQGIIVGESEENVWEIKKQLDRVMALSLKGLPPEYDGVDTPKPMSNSTLRISFTSPAGDQLWVDATPIKAVSYNRNLQDLCQLDFQVIVRASFPYVLIKDTVPVIGAGSLGSVAKGFKLGTTLPLSLANSYVTGQVVINVASPAFAVVQLNGSDDGIIVNPKITNITNDTYTQVTQPLIGSTKYFTVNGLERTIRDQSDRNLSAYAQGGFVYLEAGNNTLVYTADRLIPF